MEKTFSMIKPDGIQRGLVGEILQRFEKKGKQVTSYNSRVNICLY